MREQLCARRPLGLSRLALSLGLTVGLSASGLAAMAGCGGEEPQFTAGHDEAQAAACETPTPPPVEAVRDDGPRVPQALRTLDDGARVFGRELEEGVEAVALSAISADPTSYSDRVVRTEGTIERVCQRMGCWMELRAGDAEPVRVPMAGHSYFLPQNVAGRPATIEGRVMVQPLSDARRRHLESEGAIATASTLSIEATTVVVR